MHPRDWFGVGVRLLGVWMCLQALGEFVSYLEVCLRLTEVIRTMPGAYLVHGVVDLAAAIFLLTVGGKFFWPEQGERQQFEVVIPAEGEAGE